MHGTGSAPQSPAYGKRRSTHARIRSIDKTAARALPGVHAVVTAADVPEVRYGAFVRDRTLFAKDDVRWEGELIAAVAAATPEIAARAAALIEVDFEPLPAMTGLEAATRPDAPLVHADWASAIGLAIGRALTEAMGGRVCAESEGPGRGSAFRVALPKR